VRSRPQVRLVFDQARRLAPSIIFFDEIDALVSSRSAGGDSSGGVQQRMLATLLNEMDGVDRTSGVLVVAATNRLDVIDAALLRPGRFDELIYIGSPATVDDHVAILQVHTSNMPVAPDVNLRALAEECLTLQLSGASISALCREAAMHSLRSLLPLQAAARPTLGGMEEAIGQRCQQRQQQGEEVGFLVCMEHFRQALRHKDRT
jgi:SpoVK/Ycf46/Vps4 family AAA+-type ATPase